MLFNPCSLDSSYSIRTFTRVALIGLGITNQLEPVHFLEVSHHGSVNSTAEEDSYKTSCPSPPRRVAVISTFPEIYHNVPDEGSTRMLNERGLMVLEINQEVRPSAYVEIEFPALGCSIRKNPIGV